MNSQTATIGLLPIPLHHHQPRCNHWAKYGLPCSEYDGLLWRSGNRCEVCRVLPQEVQKRPLYVDHDGRLGTGWNHVRGLLCSRCNVHMGYVDNGYRTPTPAQSRYLASAWFWTGLPEWQLEQPWLPEPGSNPSRRALWWKDNPNRRWNRSHPRFDPPPD